MGWIDRRLARLESTYQSGDEWPPELIAEALSRLGDRELEVFEGYCYPLGLENAPDPLVVDWDRPQTEEEADAFGALEALIGDVKYEWGV